MSRHPNRNSLDFGNDRAYWIPSPDRFQFILAFTVLTVLGSWLSHFPISMSLGVLRDAFPVENVSPPNLSNFLDLFSGGAPEISREREILESVLVRAIAGIVVGFSQWIILRKYLPGSRWMMATTIGFTLSGIATFSGPVLHFYIGPILQGLMQWLALRSQVRWSWTWIFVPVLVVLVQALVLFLFGFAIDQRFKAWALVMRPVLDVLRPALRMVVMGLVPAVCLCFYRTKSRAAGAVGR